MYTQKEFDHDLKAILASLDTQESKQQPSIRVMKQASFALGRAILKAKDHLQEEEFWTILEQNDFSRTDAWWFTDYLKETSLMRIFYGSYMQRMKAMAETSRHIAEGNRNLRIPNDVKLLKWQAHHAETLALMQEMDHVLPRSAGLPPDYLTNEQMYLNALRNRLEHPEDYEDDPEEENTTELDEEN
jgi:vacuolar-type H+-ATPase catalytic subunit A/Vma1